MKMKFQKTSILMAGLLPFATLASAAAFSGALSRSHLLRAILPLLALGTFCASAAAADPSTPLRVYLEWAADPSTDAIISWHDHQQKASLAYRPANSNGPWQSVAGDTRDFPLRPEKIHSVTLSGLTPNTRYDFRLGATLHAFRTLPSSLSSPDGRPLEIVWTADCQEPRFWEPNSAWSRITDHIAEVAPDLIIAGGDYLAGDGVVSEANSDAWAAWLDILGRKLVRPDGTLVPVIYLIGNHDVHGGTGAGSFRGEGEVPYVSTLFRFLYQPGPNIGGQGWGWFSVGRELLVVCLESHHSVPAAPQAVRVREYIKAHGDEYRHVMLASHIPPITAGNTPSGVAFRRNLGPTLSRHPNIMYWLVAHQHIAMASNRIAFSDSGPWHGDPNGIRFIGAGGWGAPAVEVKNPGLRSPVDGTPYYEWAVMRNAIVGNPTNRPAALKGTWDDPATKHFWRLTISDNGIRARCLNIEGQLYYDHTDLLPSR